MLGHRLMTTKSGADIDVLHEKLFHTKSLKMPFVFLQKG